MPGKRLRELKHTLTSIGYSSARFDNFAWSGQAVLSMQ
jgi:hypothetical protein